MVKSMSTDFVIWFTGMDRLEIDYAHEVYEAERYMKEEADEEDHKLAMYEQKYELPVPPPNTAKKLLAKKDREIRLLKDEISRLVYLSEQPGGYHP